MKFGNVIKGADGASVTSEQLAKINRLTRKELSEDDVYIFPIVACDNELDRDFDKFTSSALKELSALFIGKTIICDHNRKNANQIARIFDAEVVKDTSITTKDGSPLEQLKVWAYMLKNEDTQPVIDNIDAGIYKEVSVGCSVTSQTCSICKNEYYSGDCVHWKSETYDNKLCFTYLDKAADAYELSFVAVPAQPGAGVIKWYKGEEKAKNKNTKGKNAMTYEEIKSKLEAIGVDLDGISAEKGVIPPLTDILGAVSKAFDEYKTCELKSTEDFISEKTVKSILGEDATAEKAVEMLKSVSELEAKNKEFEEKAKAYDALKSEAIEEALVNGVKAKGEKFDTERYRKMFENFSLEEIKGFSADFADEAKKELKVGRHSETDENAYSIPEATDMSKFKL